MSNIITFNARGTNFSIPKLLLKKYPDTLLHNICNYDSIPVDKINSDIFIDINPSSISTVIDLYHRGNVEKLYIQSISLYMDLKFLGFDVKYNEMLPYKMNPIIFDNCESDTPKINVNFEYTRIHTTDSNVIIIDNNTLNNWMNCKFKLIAIGHYEDYIIGKNTNYIDVWIGLNTFKTHYMLSILRDGLNWYYYDYPLTYNNDVNNIGNFNCKNIEDEKHKKNYTIGSPHGPRGDHNDCEISKVVRTCYQKFDNEVEKIMCYIDIINSNHIGIFNFTKKLQDMINYNQYIFNINNKAISEYIIDDELLNFYGLLNDDIKNQLNDRKNNFP